MSKKNRQESKAADKAAAGPQGSRLADYFWANLIFFAFLLVLSGVVYKSCEAPGDDPAVQLVLKETFKFMLLLFGGGFLVVTLFDAAFEAFAAKADEDEPGGGAQAPQA
jgi:hypothetical protein